ncbi:hypothetical protein GmHk_05G012846 [Glycine max]|nr:hypothetical protein GmHk_05G012846 [Glycine max]
MSNPFVAARLANHTQLAQIPLVLEVTMPYDWGYMIDDSQNDFYHPYNVRTHHQSKPFVGSPFRHLGNQLCLLPRSMIVPTNQHKTFQRALSSITCFLGNFLEGHPSHICSKPSTFNC